MERYEELTSMEQNRRPAPSPPQGRRQFLSSKWRRGGGREMGGKGEADRVTLGGHNPAGCPGGKRRGRREEGEVTMGWLGGWEDIWGHAYRSGQGRPRGDGDGRGEARH